MDRIDPVENKERMLAGRLYYAFQPDLIQERQRCQKACRQFNATAGDSTRREQVALWRAIRDDKTPLPPPAATKEEDDALFWNEPWVEPPVHMDFGTNVHVAQGTFFNYNTSFVDTCRISIGERCIFGPNCSIISGSHPTDPHLRNGLNGPEDGKEVEIGDDCWLGANVVVLPGVKIGRGCTIGAGAVVTKNIPEYSVAVGNPARVMRKVDDAEKSGRAHLERTGQLP